MNKRNGQALTLPMADRGSLRPLTKLYFMVNQHPCPGSVSVHIAYGVTPSDASTLVDTFMCSAGLVVADFTFTAELGRLREHAVSDIRAIVVTYFSHAKHLCVPATMPNEDASKAHSGFSNMANASPSMPALQNVHHVGTKLLREVRFAKNASAKAAAWEAMRNGMGGLVGCRVLHKHLENIRQQQTPYKSDVAGVEQWWTDMGASECMPLKLLPPLGVDFDEIELPMKRWFFMGTEGAYSQKKLWAELEPGGRLCEQVVHCDDVERLVHGIYNVFTACVYDPDFACVWTLCVCLKCGDTFPVYVQFFLDICAVLGYRPKVRGWQGDMKLSFWKALRETLPFEEFGVPSHYVLHQAVAGAIKTLHVRAANGNLYTAEVGCSWHMGDSLDRHATTAGFEPERKRQWDALCATMNDPFLCEEDLHKNLAKMDRLIWGLKGASASTHAFMFRCLAFYEYNAASNLKALLDPSMVNWSAAEVMHQSYSASMQYGRNMIQFIEGIIVHTERQQASRVQICHGNVNPKLVHSNGSLHQVRYSREHVEALRDEIKRRGRQKDRANLATQATERINVGGDSPSAAESLSDGVPDDSTAFRPDKVGADSHRDKPHGADCSREHYRKQAGRTGNDPSVRQFAALPPLLAASCDKRQHRVDSKGRLVAKDLLEVPNTDKLSSAVVAIYHQDPCKKPVMVSDTVVMDRRHFKIKLGEQTCVVTVGPHCTCTCFQAMSDQAHGLCHHVYVVLHGFMRIPLPSAVIKNAHALKKGEVEQLLHIPVHKEVDESMMGDLQHWPVKEVLELNAKTNQVKVSWRGGFGHAHDSWVPIDDVDNRLVDEFMLAQADAKAMLGRSKQGSAKAAGKRKATAPLAGAPPTKKKVPPPPPPATVRGNKKAPPAKETTPQPLSDTVVLSGTPASERSGALRAPDFTYRWGLSLSNSCRCSSRHKKTRNSKHRSGGISGGCSVKYGSDAKTIGVGRLSLVAAGKGPAYLGNKKISGQRAATFHFCVNEKCVEHFSSKLVRGHQMPHALIMPLEKTRLVHVPPSVRKGVYAEDWRRFCALADRMDLKLAHVDKCGKGVTVTHVTTVPDPTWMTLSEGEESFGNACSDSDTE